MARGWWVLAVLCAAASGIAASPGGAAERASATPTASLYAPVAGVPDHPPSAWPDYCARHPDDCEVNLIQPLTLDLTPLRWDQLKAVNVAVNRIVRPMTDFDHWGVEDHWDQAEDGYGDCEDYQLLKRKLLVELGFPRRAMLMTVAHDEEDKGHALLMLHTSSGDLILDNLIDDVRSWRETGYRFVQRESQYASGWVDIEKLPDTNAVVAGIRGTTVSGTTAAALTARPYDLAGPSDGGAD